MAVMMYLRFPLSLQDYEEPLHERGIDISLGSVQFRWHRFEPGFTAVIQRRRIKAVRSSRWKMHGILNSL